MQHSRDHSIHYVLENNLLAVYLGNSSRSFARFQSPCGKQHYNEKRLIYALIKHRKGRECLTDGKELLVGIDSVVILAGCMEKECKMCLDSICVGICVTEVRTL